ncbi:MAG TPA: hypothetical protein ENI22_01475 [Candidatus Pacearchaeota archaeon]|nr:hypothetical protein [Candidatus Pacearchaeota archaeon]
MAVATNIELPKLIVRRIVDQSIAIPLGTIMKFTGTNTAAASAADGDAFAGITIEEKTAGDGITEVGCALDGVWMIDTTAAAIAVGTYCSIGGSQTIAISVGTADLVDGSQFCRSEMVRDGDNRIRVRLLG